MRTLLIVDCSAVCYRAFFGIKNQLSHEDEPTAVIYGFLTQLLAIKEDFYADGVVFTFDYGRSLRREVYPNYKSSRRTKRKEQSIEDKILFSQLQAQMYQLRTEILPEMGYKNVFFQKGYEADDVIASLCHNSLAKDEYAIVVSNDEDLFQLLTKRISIWNPSSHKRITLKSFQKQYRISAPQWADVKAIAGCDTDDVAGVAGVGNITACKFLGGILKPTTKAHKKIVESRNLWDRNLPLVKLPYEGTETFVIQEDKIKQKKWDQMMEKYGMESLKGETPL